jgi:hypothetical protein
MISPSITPIYLPRSEANLAQLRTRSQQNQQAHRAANRSDTNSSLVPRAPTHFRCRRTAPSEMLGVAAPALAALFLIQSRAIRLLSSVPALS